MKKARRVKVSDVINKEEYDELLQHAKNSCMWYQNNYFRTSNQLREKLYEKGYPKESVVVKDNEVEEERNLVEETMKFLEDIHLIDDEEYAKSFIESALEKGKGPNYIRGKAWEKKIDKDLIESNIEEITDDRLSESLEKTVTKIKSNSAYNNKSEPWQKKQYLVRRLIQSGFDYSDISAYIEED